jgi:hypothetical protein
MQKWHALINAVMMCAMTTIYTKKSWLIMDFQIVLLPMFLLRAKKHLWKPHSRRLAEVANNSRIKKALFSAF